LKWKGNIQVQMVLKWIKVPFLHKTLFWGFVNQEIKGRYAGSMGGFLWSIITPLANMLIFIFVFSVVFKIRLKPVETGTDSFVMFLLTGLLPWIAFSEAVSASTGMFVGKANLITKVAFPLELVPTAGILVTFILNGIGFILLLIYLAFEGYCHITWLFLPVITALFMIFTLGIVVLVASISVFVRDIQQIMPSVLNLWVYLTPILYPVQMVPESLQIFIKINPVIPFIELYHQCLLQHVFSFPLLGQAIGFAMVSFLSGVWFYNKSRNAFADVL
jgi:lipopolysaccharide transport system permease protein